jgi:hypothetical protein
VGTDPNSIYKPSTSNSNNYKEKQLDVALEEQKYKIDSRKMQRNQ